MRPSDRGGSDPGSRGWKAMGSLSSQPVTLLCSKKVVELSTSRRDVGLSVTDCPQPFVVPNPGE